MANGNGNQSVFTESLRRIEPTRGFIEYIEETKPYHTKILDVLIEYVYAEAINVTITDSINWEIEFGEPDVDVVRSCGYDLVWDPVLTVDTPDDPLAPLTILEATESIDVALPGSENSNSFLIQPSTFESFQVAVVNIVSNQLVLSKNYEIIGKDTVANEWEIDDPLNALVTELTTGTLPKIIYITSDTGTLGNGRYEVVGATHLAGVTSVEVVETVPFQANGDGVFHRPLDNSVGNELPAWPAAQAVVFTAGAGTLPAPIVDGTRYYLQPLATPAHFVLSTVRYPTALQHYVDLGTLGFGDYTVARDESVIPGATLTVRFSHYQRNDGVYIVRDVVLEGGDERVFVYQDVESSTPPAYVGGDGQMFLGDYGTMAFTPQVYCPLVQAPGLFTDTFIGEKLKFTFEFSPVDMIDATYRENPIQGFGETPFSEEMFGPYGTNTENYNARTAQTSGNPGPDSAHMLLPTGIDTQLYDLGGLEENIHSVKRFYGRTSP